MMRFVLFLLCPGLVCAAPKALIDANGSGDGVRSDPKGQLTRVGKDAGKGQDAPREAPPVDTVDPAAKGVVEFSGDPIDVVFRTLARKANINLVVSPDVAKEAPLGVNMRLENKSAKEVIEVICHVHRLLMTEKGGVYYVRTKYEDDREPAKDFAKREKMRLDALMAEGFKREEAMQILLRKAEEMKPVKPKNSKE